jgi:Uncharacterized protein encoded in toxicity protection region of plasmid R478, contains von Willebrand factor (vWF) domain
MRKYLKLMVSVFLIFVILFTSACRRELKDLTEDDAKTTLNSYLKKISISDNQNPVKDIAGAESISLANINKYPLSVETNAEISVEIFTSTEKGGTGNDGWINDIAKRFNESNQNINGKTIGVEIRPIASGLAMDYLTSKTYTPDAFSPSNELWIEMLKSKEITPTLIEKTLVGNTAGVLIKNELYNNLKQAHGEINLAKIAELGISKNITFGYTSPYASSTGLNMLVSILTEFDKKDPLSDNAVNQMIQFQGCVPPALLTTAQMRDSASNGLIDIMVMEYQAYINEPILKDYIFIPMGVRHDSPLYAVKELSDDKTQVLKLFSEFCKNSESQKLAVEYGFNQNKDYVGADITMSGSELYQAQSLWKENKEGGKPIIAVFVADLSGSMQGSPLKSLQNALVGASPYIGQSNYIGLVSYSSSVVRELPITQFDNNQRALFNGVVKKFQSNGSTYTHEALMVAADMVLAAKEQHPDATGMIFLLTDGESNGHYEYKDSAPIIKGLKIPVHCIGFNHGSDELDELSKLVEASYIKADNDDVSYQLKLIFQNGL